MTFTTKSILTCFRPLKSDYYQLIYDQFGHLEDKGRKAALREYIRFNGKKLTEIKMKTLFDMILTLQKKNDVMQSKVMNISLL